MNARFLKLGWILFLATLAVVAIQGFQTVTEKTGVADINQMIEQSQFGKSIQDQLDKMRTARQDILSFIDSNRVMTTDQAVQLRDLTLKATRSKEEQAQLDSLRASIMATTKKWQDMATKPSLTPEERTLMDDFSQRAQKTVDLGQRWVNDFSTDLGSWTEKRKSEANKRARAAIQEVARAQGYTMVYDSVFVPYGANDITGAALQAMDNNK